MVRELKTKMPITDVMVYVNKFCADLNLPDNVEREATIMMKTIQDHGACCGVSPPTVAMVAIRYACEKADMGITYWNMAKIAEVTDVSLSANYRKAMDKIFKEAV